MMRLMNKLTRLTLSAAMVPVMTMGAAALASDHSDSDMQVEEQGEGTVQQPGGDNDGLGNDQEFDQEQFEQDQMDQDGMDQDGMDQDGLGQDRMDQDGMDQDFSDQQRSGDGEDFMAGKPAGALYGDDIIGKTIKHRGSNEDIGQIEDLIVGEDGQVVGVIVTTGGFLGLGGQEVSLNWDQLNHSMEEDDSVFYIDMDEESLRNAPEHQRD